MIVKSSLNVFVSAMPGILIKTTFVSTCTLSRQVVIKTQMQNIPCAIVTPK